eukprot:Gb_15487 [translate_table: standard]
MRIRMSSDRTTVGKRKAAQEEIINSFDDDDNEDQGLDFRPPALRPIVTASKAAKICSSAELSHKKLCYIDFVLDCSHDDQEAQKAYGEEWVSTASCETPKSEEHKIPEILCCPPPPRKPKATAKRKASVQGAGFFVPCDLNLLFLPHRRQEPKKFQVR